MNANDYDQIDIYHLLHQRVISEPHVAIYVRDDVDYEFISRRDYVKMLQEIKQDIEKQLEKYEAEYPGVFENESKT